MAHIGFGGGCHWCTEAVFKSLIGVTSVEQGFIRSTKPDHIFSEAVQIFFEPTIISLAVLIEIHLRTHSSSSNHKMRNKYRSAVYTTNTQQSIQASDCIKVLAREFNKPIITRVLALEEFNASPEHYQNYYAKNSQGEFCQRFIDPKLALLKRQFQDQYVESTSSELR